MITIGYTATAAPLRTRSVSRERQSSPALRMGCGHFAGFLACEKPAANPSGQRLGVRRFVQ